LDKNTWSNFGKAKTYIYFGGEWSEMKLITGDVPIGPAGGFNLYSSNYVLAMPIYSVEYKNRYKWLKK